MKGPKFLLLLVAAAAVAALAWYMHRAERAGWRENAVPAGGKILGDFPVNDVASVTLTGPDGRVTLQRGVTGWSVAERAGYPADFERVASLVLGVSGLEALQSVPVGAADHGVLALRSGEEGIPREEAGTLVELNDTAGRPLAALLVGKMHMTTAPGMPAEMGGTPGGRYVMPAAGGGNAYLVAESFPGLETAPPVWIDKTFVRPGPPRRLEVRSKDTEWVLSRAAAGAPWEMEGLRKNQSLDATKAAGLDAMLTGMAVADVADGPDDARAKPLEENPVTVTADTFDGVRYVLTIGRGDGDNLPVKVAAGVLSNEAGPVTDEMKKAREEELAATEKFKDRVVFLPRNFVAPFLQQRAELLTGGKEEKK